MSGLCIILHSRYVDISISASFVFAVAIMFAITDLDAVLNTGTSFPLAEIYHQATGNTAITFVLLLIIILAQIGCVLGTYIVVSMTRYFDGH